MLESKAGLTVIRPAWLEIVIRRKTAKITGERNLVRKYHHIGQKLILAEDSGQQLPGDGGSLWKHHLDGKYEDQN